VNIDQHRKVTADHLRRRAYLYVRQSTLRQVFENTESTRRQYALRERAVAMGWPLDRVVVIDSDLGQSGADSDREGFQKLVAAVGLGEVGIVLGLEVSRLARSSVDWHRLLEICALTNTLILDEDGLYEPGHFNDRLLLGLKGTMSEAELHVLHARLIGGQRAKASRGELEQPLPVGLVTGPDGKVTLDPDQQVQNAVRTFFETFLRTGSATATVRSFREQGLLFPRRFRTGPRKGEVAWGPLLHHRALRILKNPRYTGAFTYGRTETRRTAGGGELRRLLPQERWHTLILDAHPGYITWADYEENLRRLHDNAQANGAERRKSPPREGPALLQGLAICGRCGERMGVRYYRARGELVPDYVCQKDAIEHGRPPCQRLVGHSLDRSVGDLLVETVTPLALEVALAVQDELQQRADEADTLRRQQVERARYEAELAQRRYLRVDPDNRLVADSLEAEWNEKLRALSAAQEDYERRRAEEAVVVDDRRRREVLALATDFPRLWRDPRTTNRERKRMVRLLLDDVTLIRTHEIIAHVRFRGGATRTLHLPLPLPATLLRKTDPAIVAEIDRLLDDHTEGEAAALLNQRGVLPHAAAAFTPVVVNHIRRTHGLRDRFTRLRETGLLTLDEVAAAFGVHPRTVKCWQQENDPRIVSHVYNDKGQRLYAPPSDRPPAVCQWCGTSITTTSSARGRPRRWCRPACCYAAYRSRKRSAAVTSGSFEAPEPTPRRHVSVPDPPHEVQSVA
jgi:DNA invertase Pin-like site-specific DNA recombinase